ncbi:MAG TPA: radical SAM protein [Elusimicrobiales bacterium]|nr:radical SAM protein [Elusimicrobiales bacterium]
MTKLKALSASAASKKYGWPRTRPKICEVTINFECNARCVFCYSPHSQPAWQKGSLSLKEIGGALKRSRLEGAWLADILGGEVTLRKDLPEIALLARKLGYTAVQITTNGMRLAAPDYVKRLIDSGINVFRMSLHGDRPEIHDAIVGVSGGFRQTTRGLENVLRLGAKAGINHVILPANYELLPGLVKFTSDNFGLDAYLFISPHYLGSMKTNGSIYKISYSRYMPYLKKALNIFERKGLTLESPCLSNFVPCVLPGFENLMAEWQYQKEDDLLYVPNQAPLEIYKMKEAQRMKVKRCRDCVYDPVCMGFEREYYKYFGGGEFVPLKKKQTSLRLKTFYAG